MEKKAVIEPGITPPEEPDVKQASAEALEEHTSKRIAEAMAGMLKAANKGQRMPTGERLNQAVASNHAIPYRVIPPQE